MDFSEFDQDVDGELDRGRRSELAPAAHNELDRISAFFGTLGVAGASARELASNYGKELSAGIRTATRVATFTGPVGSLGQTATDVASVHNGGSVNRAIYHLAVNTAAFAVAASGPAGASAGLAVLGTGFGAELAFDYAVAPAAEAAQETVEVFHENPQGFIDRLFGLPQFRLDTQN